MKSAMLRYLDAWERGDIEAATSLFAPEAVIEDPYGAGERKGTDAIRGFFAVAMDRGTVVRLDVPVRASMGDSAAMAVTVTTPGGRTKRVIDVMRFDKDVKITRLTAFWGDSDFVRGPEHPSTPRTRPATRPPGGDGSRRRPPSPRAR